MKPRLILLVLAGLLLGADKPKEVRFEISASGDRAIVKSAGFELEGSRITYDQIKSLFICEGNRATCRQKRNNEWELIQGSRIAYNLKDGAIHVESGSRINHNRE